MCLCTECPGLKGIRRGRGILCPPSSDLLVIKVALPDATTTGDATTTMDVELA